MTKSLSQPGVGARRLGVVVLLLAGPTAALRALAFLRPVLGRPAAAPRIRAVRSAARAVVVCAGILGGARAASGAQGSVDIQARVAEDLRRNAGAVGACTFTVTETWAELGARAARSRLRLREQDAAALARPETITFTARDGRLALRVRDRVDDPDHPLLEYAFDGRVLYVGDPDRVVGGNAQPLLSRHLAERLDPGERYLRCAYLRNAGVEIPSTGQELAEGEVCASVILVLASRPGSHVSVHEPEPGGEPAVRVGIVGPPLDRQLALFLQSPRVAVSPDGSARDVPRPGAASAESAIGGFEYEFDLDPALGHAVLSSSIRRPSGELVHRVTNSDFAPVPGTGAWLPRRSTTEHFTFRTCAETTFDASVLRAEYRIESDIDGGPVARSSFVLEYRKPGTLVIDNASGPEQTEFVVPADEDTLESVARGARRTATGGAEGSGVLAPGAGGRWPRAHALGVALLTVAVIGACIAVWHLARRRC